MAAAPAAAHDRLRLMPGFVVLVCQTFQQLCPTQQCDNLQADKDAHEAFMIVFSRRPRGRIYKICKHAMIPIEASQSFKNSSSP